MSTPFQTHLSSATSRYRNQNSKTDSMGTNSHDEISTPNDDVDIQKNSEIYGKMKKE
jgi:hypothetical protein